MNIVRTAVVAVALAFGVFAHAQVCSGGPEGGMDATGVQCNDPGRSPADRSRELGMAEYERGHYAAAARHFRDAAARGDARSAEILVLMHRFSAQLYGGQVTADAAEVAQWTAVAAERRRRAAEVAVTAQVPAVPR
jgi:hypothetical protein